MSDTRPVPTNLDGWVGVTDLVVPYKHILHVLWSAPSNLVSVIGVGRPGVIEHLTGATRNDEPVVLEALRELHRRGLLVLDEETREIAIRRWCRFHKFPGRWAIAAHSAFQKIESPVIKGVLVRHEGVNAIFPEKSKAASSNSNINNNVNDEAARALARTAADAAATPQGKQDQGRRKQRGDETVRYGVEVWTSADADGLQALVDRHGVGRVEEVAAGLAPAASHRAPYVSAVVEAFQQLDKAESAAAASVVRQVQLDEEAARLRVAHAHAAAAHNYLESLDDSSRAALLDEFANYLAISNHVVFQFYRRDGLKPRAVEAEFTRFIHSRSLTQQEKAA